MAPAVKCLTIRLSQDDLGCNVVGSTKHFAVLELSVAIHVVVHHSRSDWEEWRGRGRGMGGMRVAVSCTRLVNE